MSFFAGQPKWKIAREEKHIARFTVQVKIDVRKMVCLFMPQLLYVTLVIHMIVSR